MDINYEDAWKKGEIILPEVEEDTEQEVCEECEECVEYEDFILIPAAKHEMLIRDSEKLECLNRYLDTDRPTLKGVKTMLGLEERR